MKNIKMMSVHIIEQVLQSFQCGHATMIFVWHPLWHMQILFSLNGKNTHIVKTFKRAHTSGTNSNGFSTMRNKLFNGLTTHGNVLSMHVMSPNLFTFYRLESTCTYMQRQFFTVNTGFIKSFEHTLCEVKSSSWRSNGSFNFGINCLISRLVALLCRTIQIRRDRQFTYSIKQFSPCIIAIP